MKKKIAIIGQFPPPMHGLSKALDTLYNSYLSEKFDFYKVDITNNKKFLINLFKILFSRQDLYYLTISQSKFGNIRDLIIIKLIQIKQRKVIIHLHGGGFRNILDNEFSDFHKRLNYKILSKVDGGIVLGNSLKYIFKDIISDDKIFVVKNCVDDEFIISDKDFNNKMDKLFNKTKLKILYLSNFIKEKGYQEVLQLAKIMKENNDDRFKFIFAGNFFDEKDKKEFFEYIDNNNLNAIIDYKGIVGGKDKLDLLKDCDIFILLTRYKREGQPISIIEAAANGVDIVTTNHAGIKDILNGNNMIVVDKEDIDLDKIYIEIVKQINDIEKMSKRIIDNRNIILEKFSQENYLKDIETIFLNE